MSDATQSSARWGVIAGALIIQLILGTVYGYSIFWEPLSAEVFPPIVLEADAARIVAETADIGPMTIVADEETATRMRAVRQGYLKYAFSICILTFAIVMVIAGRIQDVTGPRVPAIIGACLLGLGFVLAGLMRSTIVFYLAHAAFAGVVALVLMLLLHAINRKLDQENAPIARYTPLAITAAVVVAGITLADQYVGKLEDLDRLFLLWGTIGFLAGAGIGFAYVCPIAALVKWFPEHKGLVSGIAVAGFGFGAYLFTRQKLGAIGYIQENEIVPFFVVHGLVCFVAVTSGALLLKNPPGTAAMASTADSSWQDTLHRPAFYLLWSMFFSGAMAGLMVIGILKPFVNEQVLGAGISPTEAAAIGAAAVGYLAILNALGRVAWGFVSDRVGRTTAFIMMFSIQAVTMFVLGSLSGPAALTIAAALVGFNFGGNFALFPSATADLFGEKNMGANYGWVFTAYGIAGVVGVAAGNAAKVVTGSYTAAFILAGVLCVFAVAAAVAIRRIGPAPAG